MAADRTARWPAIWRGRLRLLTEEERLRILLALARPGGAEDHAEGWRRRVEDRALD